MTTSNRIALDEPNQFNGAEASLMIGWETPCG
jgi:hypothetical protein